jgi:general secretion pathway protein M
MKFKPSLERLDARERRLLRLLLGILVVLLLVLLPVATQAFLESRRGDADQIREAIAEIESSQPAVAKAQAARSAVAERYAKATPPLSAFLDGLAKQTGIEIPETQERPTVPHGKRFEERATRIELRKVGLLNLSRFLEKVERSGHPVVISKFNLRKRLSEPDSYDVELIVSAYDRKETPKPSTSSAPAAASAAPDEEQSENEDGER